MTFWQKNAIQTTNSIGNTNKLLPPAIKTNNGGGKQNNPESRWTFLFQPLLNFLLRSTTFHHHHYRHRVPTRRHTALPTAEMRCNKVQTRKRRHLPSFCARSLSWLARYDTTRPELVHASIETADRCSGRCSLLCRASGSARLATGSLGYFVYIYGVSWDEALLGKIELALAGHGCQGDCL